MVPGAAGTLGYMPRKPQLELDNPNKAPTGMGRRILALMKANGISSWAPFAEQVLGISRQRFYSWIYKEMDPANVAAQPILRCAEMLGTNAEYLLGMSDDPRPESALTYEEAQLVQAFRDFSHEGDRERLLSIAADWVAKSGRAPSASAPFRHPPLIRHFEPASTEKEEKS